jgi:hypothetical protein
VDIERLGKENSKLRRELRSTQQKSRANTLSTTKRESELRAKERIILKKNEKLDKLNKEIGSLKKQLSLLKKENDIKVVQDKENDLQTALLAKKKTGKKKIIRENDSRSRDGFTSRSADLHIRNMIGRK